MAASPASLADHDLVINRGDLQNNESSVNELEKVSSNAAPKEVSVGAEGTRKLSGISWILVVACIESTTFLFAIDNTIVADIQAAIVEEFNEFEKLTWVSVAFMLGAAGTNLMW